MTLGDQVGAVVADGVVAGVTGGERIAVLSAEDRVALGEPGEVAADPAGVGTAGVRGQRLGLQVSAVAVEPLRELLVESFYIDASPRLLRPPSGHPPVIGSASRTLACTA